MLTKCCDANTVSPDSDAMDLVKDLAGPNAMSQRIVADGDQLVGTISLDDLRCLMSVSFELESSRN